MFYYTIDDLLTQVNEVVQKPDVQSLKIAAIGHVIDVYRKVCSSKTYEVKQFSINPMGDEINLPKNIHRLVDVGIGCRGLVESGSCFYNGKKVTFKQFGNKLRFSCKVDDDVTIVAEMLPQSEDGELMIDSRIMTACVNYCISKFLLSKSANVKQDYASMNPAIQYDRIARQEMDEARAFMGGMSNGEWRDLDFQLKNRF